MKSGKYLLRMMIVLLCLLLALSVQAETDEPEFGPALPSSLTAQEKYKLMEGLYEADITYVVEAIRAGHISCQELTWYYLQRIEKYNAPYNCFITLCDNAMEVAAQRDAALLAGTAEGTLFGVPIVVKDNIRYAGYPTTNGASWNGKDTYSATIVENLLKQGVIILGKANMSTYAQSARESTSIVKGATKNAYGPNLAPGGSSGGSAAAVSLNFAMAGLGTDTNSSLRLPAVLNGCVSMRVTRGSISSNGVTPLNSVRDIPGVITRTVADQAQMLDGMTGKTQYRKNLNEKALEGAKIGVLKELSGPLQGNAKRSEDKMDSQVLAAFERFKQELVACGAQVVEVSIPNLFALDSQTGDADGRQLLYDALCKVIDNNGLDAVLFPTYLHTPQKLGKDENGKTWDTSNQGFVNNCQYFSPPTGTPEISIPIGFHSSGAGMGASFVAKKNQEQLLLDLAYSYTQKYDKRVPPVGAPNDCVKPRLQVLYACLDGQSETGLLTDSSGEVFITTYEAWTDTRQDLPVLTRENYEFLGWSVSQDGSTGLVKSTNVSSQGISPSFADEDQTVTLYPQWRKNVASISVKQLPEKCRYVQGEDLDWTGLQILVQYADGSEALLEEGFFLTAKNLQNEQVIVSYQGKTASFVISLTSEPADRTGILIVAVIVLLASAVSAFVLIKKRLKVSV